MKKQIKTIFTVVSILVILAFTMFVVNQVASIYNNVYAMNPLLGNIVLGVLILVFAALFIIPIVLYFKLPKPLKHPTNEAEKVIFLKQVQKRLTNNKHLKGQNFDFTREEEIKRALKILDDKADISIHKNAQNVFLTTAISQNGKLDALTILVTQTKMVWEIAHIYWQRPALRDLFNVYANVGATAFLASEIENLDISRQIEPIMSAMLKSPGKALPIVGHAAHIITDSILEGSINAFLTLRVGIITKRYCDSLEAFDKKAVRRNAFIEASSLLKTLVVKSSGQVINSILNATKRMGTNTLKSGVNVIEKAALGIKTGLESIAEKIVGKKSDQTENPESLN